jgi:hypothetical protein
VLGRPVPGGTAVGGVSGAVFSSAARSGRVSFSEVAPGCPGCDRGTGRGPDCSRAHRRPTDAGKTGADDEKGPDLRFRWSEPVPSLSQRVSEGGLEPLGHIALTCENA